MKNEPEYGEMLVKDPRLGKRVKVLDVSKRRGYDVFGRLKAIRRFPEDCEIWYVIGDDSINIDAHSSNFELLDSGIQGEFDALPLTLEAMEARLRQGQVFRIEGRGSDGCTYALWYQNGRFVLLQGSNLRKLPAFHQVELALFTLLNRLGEFDR
jgi:hypothetical protein